MLILVALVIRSSTPIKRLCNPSGFQHFKPFLTFTEVQDTGLLWMYALHSPPKPKKLTHCEMLLRTRSLIMILLLTGCVESHPGEFLLILFFFIQAALFRLKHRKVYVCNLFMFIPKIVIVYNIFMIFYHRAITAKPGNSKSLQNITIFVA